MMAAVLAGMTATLDVLHVEALALATAAREVLPAVVQAGRLPPLQTETMTAVLAVMTAALQVLSAAVVAGTLPPL